MKLIYDVAVVGAGPAGSSAAYHLATRGHSVVLLDHAEFPRDKACGDGLTQHSVDHLVTMGLSDLLARSHTVNSVVLHTHGDLPHSGQLASNTTGKVLKRRELDAQMVKQARLAGAAFRPGFTVRDLGLSNDFCLLYGLEGGQPVAIQTRFVVGADGARSTVARKARLLQPESTSVGLAVRGYFYSPRPIVSAFHIHIPLKLHGYDRRFAGYGWVFPVDEQTANVGIGFFPLRRLEDTPNPRRLFEAFLAELGHSAEFADLRANDPLKGGLLVSGYDPHRTYGRRIVLVGDAAGLVDPFTGEGIAAALKSGKFGAEVITNALERSSASAPDLSNYGDLLDAEFRERFRAGEHFLQNYAFTWRVIEATIGNEGRLFDSVRTAAFDLADCGDTSFAIGVDTLLPANLPPLVFFGIEATAKQFTNILMKHSPFLRKLAGNMVDSEMSLLRLALFFSHYANGRADLTDDVVAGAAAMELCCIALDIQDSVVEVRPGDDGGRRSKNVKWANTFALVAGDCLLSETCAVLARLDDPARAMVGDASGEYCAARLEQLRLANRRTCDLRLELQLYEQMTGALVGLACGLGAHLSGAPDAMVRKAAARGRQIGVAAQLLQDAYSLLTPPRPNARHPSQERFKNATASYPLAWTFRQSASVPHVLKIPLPEKLAAPQLVSLLRSNGSLDATLDEARDRLCRIQEGMLNQPLHKDESSVASIVAMLATRAGVSPPAG